MARPSKDPRAGFDPFKELPSEEPEESARFCATCRFFVAPDDKPQGRCYFNPPHVTLIPVPTAPSVAKPQGEMSLAPVTFRPVIEKPEEEFCSQHARDQEFSHAEGVNYSLNVAAEILERMLERATDAANRPPGS